MATDTLKNRIRISTTLKPETNDLLKKYSQSTQIPISKIIENAIMTYDKFKKDKDFTVELTDKIIDDFKMVDLSIIENAVL